MPSQPLQPSQPSQQGRGCYSAWRSHCVLFCRWRCGPDRIELLCYRRMEQVPDGSFDPYPTLPWLVRTCLACVALAVCAGQRWVCGQAVPGFVRCAGLCTAGPL